MIKTPTKHGNSYAMVIDRPILKLLRAKPHTPFHVISAGRSLVLTPVRSAKDEKNSTRRLRWRTNALAGQ